MLLFKTGFPGLIEKGCGDLASGSSSFVIACGTEKEAFNLFSSAKWNSHFSPMFPTKLSHGTMGVEVDVGTEGRAPGEGGGGAASDSFAPVSPGHALLPVPV